MAVFPWWICWCDIFSLLCSEGCHGDALLWQYVFVFMCLLFFPLSVRGCLFVHVWIDHQVLIVSLSCSFRLPQRQWNPCTNEVTHWYSTTTPLSLDKGKKRLQKKKSHFSSAELKKQNKSLPWTLWSSSKCRCQTDIWWRCPLDLSGEVLWECRSGRRPRGRPWTVRLLAGPGPLRDLPRRFGESCSVKWTVLASLQRLLWYKVKKQIKKTLFQKEGCTVGGFRVYLSVWRFWVQTQWAATVLCWTEETVDGTQSKKMAKLLLITLLAEQCSCSTSTVTNCRRRVSTPPPTGCILLLTHCWFTIVHIWNSTSIQPTTLHYSCIISVGHVDSLWASLHVARTTLRTLYIWNSSSKCSLSFCAIIVFPVCLCLCLCPSWTGSKSPQHLGPCVTCYGPTPWKTLATRRPRSTLVTTQSEAAPISTGTTGCGPVY